MERTGLLSILLVLLLTKGGYSQTPVYESGGELMPEQAAFDVYYYDLDLTIDPADSTVSGAVDIHFKTVHPSNRMALALDPRLGISEIEWAGASEQDRYRPLSFDRVPDDRTLYVNFPRTLQPGTRETIRVVYRGKPKVAPNPPWDGGMVWDKTPSGEEWIAVACQMIGAWVWWPNKDHPSDRADSVAVNVTVPEHLTAVSNGRLRGETDAGNGWKTWHWFVSTPVNNYNISINAAPYEAIGETYTSVTGEEFEIMFWVLPEYLDRGRNLFPQFAEQMRFLEEILGPYPFRADKYGVAHVPYLGMEHQTIIAYGADFENDNLYGLDAGFDDLHQHELAHEWWGNLVTVWDWRDFWLHEGFGTYMQPLYAEHLGGKKAYRKMMDYMRLRIVDETDREVAPRRSMSSREITQGTRGGNVYFKGAWFLHTLRYVVGDEPFFRLLRRFAYPDPADEQKTDGSHLRFATTDDLLHLAREMTGMDLEWLFEIYLRQPSIPVLEVHRSGNRVHLRWEVPEGYAFPMPVEVKAGDEFRMLHPGPDGTMTLEAEEDVEIEPDPNHRILKRVKWMEEGRAE